MKIVTAIFETKAQAEDAVRALEDAGITPADVSLIAPNSETIPAALPKGPGLVPRLAAQEDCLPVSARLPFPASAQSLVRAGLRRRSLERQLAVWPVVWSDR